MTRHSVAIGVVIGICACSASAFAQHAAKAAARYDAANETTVSGTVTSVISAASPEGVVGVHLELSTPSGRVRVALGPAMFIGENNFYFIADDAVSVVGAKVGSAKDNIVWAREVKKGDKVLTLRNADGTPRWTLATAEDPDGCGVPHGPIR